MSIKTATKYIRVYRPEDEWKNELFSNFLELGFKKVGEEEGGLILEIPEGWALNIENGVQALKDPTGVVRGGVQSGYCFLRTRYIMALRNVGISNSRGETDKFYIIDQKTDTVIVDYDYVEPFSDEHFVCQQLAYMYLNDNYPKWEDPLEYWDA